MSLTTADLDEIRSIIEPALTKQTDTAIRPIQGEIEVLRNDISEIGHNSASIARKTDSIASARKTLSVHYTVR